MRQHLRVGLSRSAWRSAVDRLTGLPVFHTYRADGDTAQTTLDPLYPPVPEVKSLCAHDRTWPRVEHAFWPQLMHPGMQRQALAVQW
jgi:hypothetical protein